MTKSKKNIYMVQINIEYVGSVYLPYAIGAIAAYAWKNNTIKSNYFLKPFIYRRESIEKLINSIDNPYMVAFSGYIWNFEFNKFFAEKLKEKYPDCIVVFGGHSTPESTDFLDNHSYIDYLILGEGEEPFAELLCAFSEGKDLCEVSNIIYRGKDGKSIKSSCRIITDTDYPSPYTNGFFDDIVNNDKGIMFSAIMETNRGCPYRCSYCDWGSLNKKVRLFPLERVFAEVDWFSANKIEYIYCADANFGIFDLDREIAEKIIVTRIKTGYPIKFHVNYTKNSNLAVFEINKRMNEYGLSKGATLSFQSFSPTVLKNIRRSNMTFKHFSELMNLYNENNIMTYSELILGLPGETYESFAIALGKLLEAGQHTSIIVFNCYWLVNSEMGIADYMKRYKIETVSAPMHQTHCALPKEESIVEYSQMVVSTATMSRDMWVRTELMSFCVQCFHCFGLLQYFAIYLFYEQGIKYESFYERLVKCLESSPDTISGKVFAVIHEEITKASHGRGTWFYINPIFGNITWPFEEGLFLELVYHYDQVFSEIKEFLKSFKIEQPIFDELLRYQSDMLKLPDKTNFEFQYGYDFLKYFNSIYIGKKEKLNTIKNSIRINDRNVPVKWDEYAIKVVWYGRRGGNNLYTDIEQIFY